MTIRISTFKTVSDWVIAATGSRPYLLDSNFIRPSGTYYTCKLVSADPTSPHGHRVNPNDDSGRTEQIAHYSLIYQIAGFRDGSFDGIFDLSHSLREGEMRSILSEGEMAYMNHEAAIDRSIQIDTVRMEERAAFNVMFNHAYARREVRGEAPGVFDRVTILPEFKGQAVTLSIFADSDNQSEITKITFQFSATVEDFTNDLVDVSGGTLGILSSNTEKTIYAGTFTPSGEDITIGVNSFTKGDVFIAGKTVKL